MPLTPEQIQEMDAISGLGAPKPKLTPEQIMQMDAITGLGEQKSPPKEKGLFDRQRQRGADLANAVNLTSTAPTGNQQTAPETAMQGVLSNAIGGVADAVGTGLAPVVEAAGKFAYNNLMTDDGRKRIDSDIEKYAPLVQQYERNKELYARDNPRAARNFAAIRELGNVMPAVALPGATKAAGKGIQEAFTPTPKALTAADRKVYAGALYDEVAATGGGLTPVAREVYKNKILEHADLGGERATTGKTVFEDMLEAAATNKDKPLTLEGYKSLDSQLTDLIHAERSIGGISDKGRRIMDIQDTLRELVDNPSEDMVIGGSQGFKTLKEANTEYKLFKQQEEIERIINYANKTDNPATSLKAQMRVLSENKKRMASFSPQAREFIDKAAKDGKFADFLRTTAGSRLIGGMIGGMVGASGGAAMGGGLGALPGAIGGIVTGAASRSAAKALKTNQIKKIEKEIASQSKAESIPREVYNLPPAEAKKAIMELRLKQRNQ